MRAEYRVQCTVYSVCVLTMNSEKDECVYYVWILYVVGDSRNSLKASI